MELFFGMTVINSRIIFNKQVINVLSFLQDFFFFLRTNQSERG